jgi:protein TonB
MGLVVVLAAHVAIAWLLVQGLGLRLALDLPPPSLEARMLPDERAPTEPAPAWPEATVERTRPVEVVEPRFEVEPDTAPVEMPTDSVGTTAEPLPRVAPEPRREGAAIDPRHPLTQPAYPAASIRFGEEGTVTVEVRVGIDGRVREARLLKSSGHPRLDAAALEEARRVWRLRPARADGVPVEDWYAVRVSFRLDRR